MSIYSDSDSNTFKPKPYSKGPVRSYETGNISGISSRGYNRFESLKSVAKIEDKRQDDIGKAEEKAAKKYLAIIRKYLSKINLKNHDVVIRASMGASYLFVINKRTEIATMVNDLPLRNEAVARLQEVDQFIEDNYSVAYHLDQEKVI